MYRRGYPSFKANCNAAHQRVVGVLRGLEILVPDAASRQKSGLRTRFSRCATVRIAR